MTTSFDRETGAALWRIADRDATAVIRDDAMNDREAEARAALRLFRREVRREDLVLELGGHARTIVLDHDDRAVICILRRHRDVAVFTRADRIA